MKKSMTFVQLPLITKATLEIEETQYYSAYWTRLGEIFGRTFQQGAIYTIPEFPLWITVLTESVKEARWTPKFLDLGPFTGPTHSLDYERFLSMACALGKTDAFAFSPYTANYSLARRLAVDFKTKVCPGAVVLAGGAHASATAPHCIENGFDFVIRGKGEGALTNLLNQRAFGKEDYSSIPGVVCRGGGQVHEIIKAPYFFDRLPDYSLIPTSYKVHFGRIYCSAGCPYSCAFCADTLWNNRKPVYKSVSTVISEVVMLKERYGVDLILFGDEVFTLSEPYVMQLCECLKGMGVEWFCQTRTDLVNPKMLQKMATSGCKLLQMGCESASPEIMTTIRKPLSMKTAKVACEMAQEAGLNVLTYWIVGAPGENLHTAQLTLDTIAEFFDEGLTDLADYYICTPYPGTPIYNDPKTFNVVIQDDNNFDLWREDQPSIMHTADLTAREIFEIWRRGLSMIASYIKPRPEGFRTALSDC